MRSVIPQKIGKGMFGEKISGETTRGGERERECVCVRRLDYAAHGKMSSFLRDEDKMDKDGAGVAGKYR
jgi:hypothetical protein